MITVYVYFQYRYLQLKLSGRGYHRTSQAGGISIIVLGLWTESMVPLLIVGRVSNNGALVRKKTPNGKQYAPTATIFVVIVSINAPSNFI